MNYTRSQDGSLRATLRIPVRITEKELQDLKAAASIEGVDWRKILILACRDVIDWKIPEILRQSNISKSEEE